jgi:mRNA interferase MazF
MKRYEIYYARLDPVEGSEIGKTRPCVIVSLDALNSVLPTLVVCPLTSTLRPEWRSRLRVTCAGKPADICADQIRVLSKAPLTKKLGTLTKTEAAALRSLLCEMYGEP